MDHHSSRLPHDPRWLRRGLQVAVFVGALLLLTTVLYASVTVQRSRRIQEERNATATVREQAQRTAALATATAEPLVIRQSTPVPISGEAITVDNAGLVQQLARWGKGQILSTAWSPDGQYLAVGTSLGVYLYDSWTQEELRHMETLSPVLQMAFTPDGQQLVAALWNGLWQWPVPGGAPVYLIEDFAGSFVMDLTFSPTGALIVVGRGRDGHVWIWRDGEETSLRVPAGREEGQQFFYVVVSPDGQYLAASCSDDKVRVWRVGDGALVSVFDVMTFLEVVFSPDGRALVIMSLEGDVQLWDVEEGTLLRELAGADWADSFVFSPDGQYIVTADSRALKLWRTSDGTQVRVLTSNVGGLGVPSILAFSSDGEVLAWVQPVAGRVQVLLVADGTQVFALEGYSVSVGSVALSPGGQLVAVATYDGATWLWSVEEGTPRRIIRESSHLGGVAGGIVFSPDGHVLASGSSQNSVLLWPLAERTLDPTPAALVEDRRSDSDWVVVRGVAFSPDGRMLAATRTDGTTAVWRVGDSTLLYLLEPYSYALSSWSWWDGGAVFAPDGQSLATWAYSRSDDGTMGGAVHLWRAADGEFVRALGLPGEGFALDVDFSPDGWLLAAAGSDGTLQLWRLADGALLRTLESGGEVEVRTIAFSPDGQLLAAGSSEGPVHLWRVEDGVLLHTLEGHTAGVADLVFAADGGLLVTGSIDGTVRLWGVP